MFKILHLCFCLPACCHKFFHIIYHMNRLLIFLLFIKWDTIYASSFSCNIYFCLLHQDFYYFSNFCLTCLPSFLFSFICLFWNLCFSCCIVIIGEGTDILFWKLIYMITTILMIHSLHVNTFPSIHFHKYWQQNMQWVDCSTSH